METSIINFILCFNSKKLNLFLNTSAGDSYGTDFLTPDYGVAPQTPLENIRQLKKARDDFYSVSG